MKLKLMCAAALLSVLVPAEARQRVCLDEGWRFALGHTDPALDYGCGTEPFNYLTKARSVHNTGPYADNFNDSVWVVVDLPHDFVVDLPFDSVASHNHGYKASGYKFPASSVGWYRKAFPIELCAPDARVELTFEGIGRDSRVWFNGFYLGGEPSGYASATYDVTPYVRRDGGDNYLVVRSDVTLEEGWWYEGGGIYRHVWLEQTPPLRIGSHPAIWLDGDSLRYDVAVENSGLVPARASELVISVADGSYTLPLRGDIQPKDGKTLRGAVARPRNLPLWDVENPELTDVRFVLRDKARAAVDSVCVPTGFRHIAFSPDSGFVLNGRRVQLRGVNLHQDHAGVGVGVPDELGVYRLKELKKYGVNAVRSSHNPMSPALLDACDTLGILVFEENRLLGSNDYHVGQLERMMLRDRHHPSVILWGVGNEEWAVEWDDRGCRIVAELREYCHRLDPSRLVAVATAGGPAILTGADVAGYNYVMQNPIDKHRKDYPARMALGSEETSGCGTRGVYYPADSEGRMPAHNRRPDADGTLNRIERGWKFYKERPWLAGLFYWTGFDYRGEPTPLNFPATGSQFGILDYCGFPKDEAYYLRSWWTDEPTLHIFPHWNLEGHEGEEVDVWVYSNFDEVDLRVNGRSLGRKAMPADGYLSWKAVYRPGYVEAVGYRKGRVAARQRVATAGKPAGLDVAVEKPSDGSFRVVNVAVVDSKGRFVPVASDMVEARVASGRILGGGNGDSAFRHKERPVPGSDGRSLELPAFNGRVQFLVEGAGEITLQGPGGTYTISL